MVTNTLWFAILVIVVMYVVARWVRGRTETEISPPDPGRENEQVRYLIRSGGAGAAEELGTRPSGLVVSRHYFRNTDAAGGPPDPNDFYDELFIELRAPDSTQTWQNSIHVATPRGLDRMMAEEQWDSVIGGELLIVRKYDLPTILKAAIGHLEEIYEVQVQMIGGRKPELPEG